MPTLLYEYEDPNKKVVVRQRPKARPVGWRAWWEGSPYANPVGGLIDRFMDGVRNLKVPDAPKQETYPIEITRESLRVHKPDGTVVTYLCEDITDLVINFNPEATVWDRETRTNLTFTFADKPIRYYILPNRVAVLECIEFWLANRIPYREYYHQSRTFRLQSNLLYKDIQELKEKYGIVW